MSSYSLSPGLLVLGGNGFVGRAICRNAVQRGWRVHSMSRSGISPDENDAGLKSVVWHKGNAANMQDYAAVLADRRNGLSCIAHSIGVLIESGNQTHETASQKTLEAALDAVDNYTDKKTVHTFGYISATDIPGASALMSRYYEAKRTAERLLSERKDIDSVVIRPGMIYGKDRPITVPMAWMLRVATFFSGGLVPAPVHVDNVARTLVDRMAKLMDQRKFAESEESKHIVIEANQIS